MPQRYREEILARIRNGYSLPVLSPVAVRLIEMASSETCLVQDMACLIEQDQSLAVRVVNLSNAAFFRTGAQVTSIDHAIQRVGFNRLRVMALTLSLRDIFPMGRVGPVDYEEFWRVSLYRAVFAKSLAARLGTCNPDEAFLSALTLEVGFLIFADMFLKDRRDIERFDLHHLDALLVWETKQFGVNHREIGEEALRYWGFPEEIVECQRYYHLGFRDEIAPQLAAICDIARSFSSIVNEKAASWHIPFYEAKTVCGIESDLLVRMLSTAFDEVQDISMSLKLVRSRDKDIMAVLEKAREALKGLAASAEQWHAYAVKRVANGNGTPVEKEFLLLKRRLRHAAGEIKEAMRPIHDFAFIIKDSLERMTGPCVCAEAIIAECGKLNRTLALLPMK